MIILVALAPSPAAPPAPATPTPPAELDKPALQKTAYEEANAPFTNASTQNTRVRICARVNEIAILEEDVLDASLPMELQLPEPERSARRSDIRNRELQKIIDRELVILDALATFGAKRPQYLLKLKEVAGKEFNKHLASMKANIEQKNGITLQSNDDLKKILATQGVTLEGYRRQYERNFMSLEYLRARIYPVVHAAIGHREIVDYYEQHAAEFETHDSVHWQDIFIDVSKFPGREEARLFAGQLVARARAGEDFVQLVNEYDNGDSRYRQGEGIGHRRGEIRPPEIEPILFEMRVGEVAPPVEVRHGFHVIRLAKRDFAGRKPLDTQIQTEIRKKLQGDIAEKESRRILAELRRKASIEIIEKP